MEQRLLKNCWTLLVHTVTLLLPVWLSELRSLCQANALTAVLARSGSGQCSDSVVFPFGRQRLRMRGQLISKIIDTREKCILCIEPSKSSIEPGTFRVEKSV